MLMVLAGGLAVWLFGCGYAGYHRRFGLFAVVLLAGLALNFVWMYYGLFAHPLSPDALMAQVGAVMYALSALGVGWYAGRMVRSFRESRVDPQ